MSSAQFVRPARITDVETVVDLQVASWRAVYGDLLPDRVTREMASDQAREQFREQWTTALESPPTSRHRLVVATDEIDGERTVTGFAALGPAGDPDLWPATDSEIFALHVDPERTRQGHGSRLVNACVDHLVEDGFPRCTCGHPRPTTHCVSFSRRPGGRPTAHVGRSTWVRSCPWCVCTPPSPHRVHSA